MAHITSFTYIWRTFNHITTPNLKNLEIDLARERAKITIKKDKWAGCSGSAYNPSYSGGSEIQRTLV
jgi:hypothetical protein